MKRFAPAIAASFLILSSGCTMFPDPNQAAITERRSLTRQISALQQEEDLTADESATLAKLKTVVSSGQRFDGNKVEGILSGIEQAVDRRRVIAAGHELEKSRREKYLFTHPKTPQAIRDAITKGNVVTGMSADEVVASWGEPLQKSRATGAKNNGEQWVYGGNIYLYLEGRKVVSINGAR